MNENRVASFDGIYDLQGVKIDLEKVKNYCEYGNKKQFQSFTAPILCPPTLPYLNSIPSIAAAKPQIIQPLSSETDSTSSQAASEIEER